MPPRCNSRQPRWLHHLEVSELQDNMAKQDVATREVIQGMVRDAQFEAKPALLENRAR